LDRDEWVILMTGQEWGVVKKYDSWVRANLPPPCPRCKRVDEAVRNAFGHVYSAMSTLEDVRVPE
jgi:hypothetical protein